MSQTTKQLPPNVRHKHGAYYYVSPTRKWVRLGSTLEESLPKYQEVMADRPADGTLGAVIERYMKTVAPAKAPRTYDDNKKESQLLLKVFGKMRPTDVRPMHVAKYLDERGKDAPIRANREKALLSHIFTMAMRWGIVDANPCRGVHGNSESGRSRYISDEEYLAVLGLANPVVADMMEMALCTGQRIGDLLTIRTADVDKDGVFFAQNKTGAKVKVLHSDAMRVIVDRRKGGVYLFEHPSRNGMAPYTYFGFSCMFKRTVAKAITLGLINEGFTFHDIRAKALTDAKRAGMDAQRIAGHSSPTMTAHYIKKREVEIVNPVR